MSKKSFAIAYGNLPGKLQTTVRDEIIEECGWNTTQYFSMKKSQANRVLTLPEEEKVEAIFKKYGFDAWTGEPL